MLFASLPIVLSPSYSANGFLDSSVGKESACKAGDPGLIPGSGRSAGEGIDYPLQYSWACLVALLVKNPPAKWEIWVRSLGWEDPKRLLTPVSGLENSMNCVVHGVTKSWTQLTLCGHFLPIWVLQWRVSTDEIKVPSQLTQTLPRWSWTNCLSFLKGWNRQMTDSRCPPGREQTVLLWTAGGQRGSGGPRAALGQQSARKQGCQPHIWRSEFCQHCWACKWTFRGGQLDFSQYRWTEVPANVGKDWLVTLNLGSPETRDLAWGQLYEIWRRNTCHALRKGPEVGDWGLSGFSCTFLLLLFCITCLY